MLLVLLRLRQGLLRLGIDAGDFLGGFDEFAHVFVGCDDPERLEAAVGDGVLHALLLEAHGVAESEGGVDVVEAGGRDGDDARDDGSVEELELGGVEGGEARQVAGCGDACHVAFGLEGGAQEGLGFVVDGEAAGAVLDAEERVVTAAGDRAGVEAGGEKEMRSGSALFDDLADGFGVGFVVAALDGAEDLDGGEEGQIVEEAAVGEVAVGAAAAGEKVGLGAGREDGGKGAGAEAREETVPGGIGGEIDADGCPWSMENFGAFILGLHDGIYAYRRSVCSLQK